MSQLKYSNTLCFIILFVTSVRFYLCILIEFIFSPKLDKWVIFYDKYDTNSLKCFEMDIVLVFTGSVKTIRYCANWIHCNFFWLGSRGLGNPGITEVGNERGELNTNRLSDPHRPPSDTGSLSPPWDRDHRVILSHPGNKTWSAILC